MKGNEMSEWQKIETAPKDTLLLLACANWPLMVKGRPVPIKVGGYWDDQWNIFGASWVPTHWMPLPNPPSDE